MNLLRSLWELNMSLVRVCVEWVGTWPLWLQIALIVLIGPVMVIHFLLWVTWRLGWYEDETDNVVPFHKEYRR